MAILLILIDYFFASHRQSSANLLGHFHSSMTLPAPLIQCCMPNASFFKWAIFLLQHWLVGEGGDSK